ncbi:MAG: aldehyde dehydrogenase family protein [Pseudomonadota bacterium]
MLTCISPIDGSVYVSRDPQDLDEALAAVSAARAAQPGWAARDLAERVAIVNAGVAALCANGALVDELAHQMGRPVRYGGEMGGVKERADHMAAIAAETLAPTEVERSNAARRLIKRTPLGVVLAIAPWNYPYLTAINTIVPALIAGNALVLKHATQTILAGERLREAFLAGGVPEALFVNLQVTHDTIDGLIRAKAFDFINFTGSVAAGRTIERSAAGTFAGVSLELGGKDPGYVRADADLDRAVDGLIDGAMFNTGQCCCGIERIYVAEPLFEAFVDKARAIVEGYVLGNPLHQATTLGPMAHKRLADVVRDQVIQAVTAGAEPLIDPALFPADDGTTAYLAPQILVNVDHDMALMREENFGPVVGIMKVSSDDEAVALMNDSAYGLTASIWTGDTDAAEAIGDRLETGTVFMNRCDYLDPALCWTGCKDTGRGASLSTLGYHSLTRPKSFHLKT